MNLEDINLETAMTLALPFLGKIGLALILLVIGLFMIRVFSRFLNKVLDKARIDPALHTFVKSLVSIGLKVLLAVSVISTLGVEMTSFVALLGGAGVAFGLALSGTLQNFASGVMILFFKPFKVGDFIEANSFTGTVKEIQIFNTILTPLDNRTVIIPNQELANKTLVNYSEQAERRVDLKIGVSYSADSEHVKAVLRKVIDADPRVVRNDEAQILFGEFGDSAIIYYLRFWTLSADYFLAKCEIQEQIKLKFDAEQISFPFPQRDIHLYQMDSKD